MSIATFNTYLLRKCTKNLRLGPDVRSLLKRYQTLSIIYANLIILLMVGFFEVFSLFYGLEYHYIMLVISPFVILSFISLKKGNNDLAAISVLMYLHLGNRYASNFCKASLTALATLFMFPNFSYFMSSSTKVQVTNLIMCGLQAIGHIYNFRDIFAITMTQDQAAEIHQLTAATFGVFSFLCVISFLQKNLESNMWQLNYLDQEKAEQITKEVMQAVESKEAFISSLSHEIRNPLNSMSGSISYLLEVVRDPQHRQILNNAKLSGEILLNLINNLLDTAKLKSEKMELSNSETSLVEVFKKALTINSEKLKKGRLFVDAFISKEIPNQIWTDPSRLLQIMMNLISNCIKFTPEEGKITIYASWCDEDEGHKALLAPIGSIQASKIGNASRSTQQSTHNELQRIKSLKGIDLDTPSPEYYGGFEELSYKDIKTFSKNLSIRPIEIKTLGQLNTYNANNSRDYGDLGSEEDKPWSIERVEMNWSRSKTPQNNRRYQKIEPSKRGYLKIQISDTGCGIPEESIPKLFEMFTQANRTITSSYGGTGLGLWICKQLCQKMGGDIKLASKVRKGTDFVFYIAVQNESLLDPSYSHPFRDFRSSDRVTALVVDDYGYNRDLHKLLLQREGVDVVLACDGEEALEIYSKNPKTFDFVLMDVQMPRMDGFTAAKKIRELEAKNEWKKMDIYFVSAEYYSEEEVIASFKASSGIKELLGIRCIKKPVDIVIIKTLVERYKKKNL